MVNQEFFNLFHPLIGDPARILTEYIPVCKKPKCGIDVCMHPNFSYTH